MSSVVHMLDAQFSGPAGFSVLAKRNCSIAPAPLCALFIALGGVSLGIAAAWGLIAGAWLVLPFAGLEVGALALAFVWHARRVGDFERISLEDGKLVVEICEHSRVERHEFNPRWARLVVAPGQDARLALRSHGRELEIGRHLDTGDRRRLAAELQRAMMPRHDKNQFDT